MNPASPDAENDDLQLSSGAAASSQVSQGHPSSESSPLAESGLLETSPSETGLSGAIPLESSSLKNLQRRYADQLNNEIEQLEAEKAKLQTEVSNLKQEYAQIQAQTKAIASESDTSKPEKLLQSAGDLTDDNAEVDNATTEVTHSSPVGGPILPGEKEAPPSPPIVSAPPKEKSKGRAIELPTPATSEQRRQLVIQRQRRIAPVMKAKTRQGFILSAIATLLTAWHYGLINALHQGGSWLGTDIGQISIGFVPAVALLWLRMLVMVPALVLLAPQLHHNTWDDLQDWFYHDDQRFIPLVGSGIALFFSQIFLYQSIGNTGAVVGSTLLFLYPLTAIPLGLLWSKDQPLTPFGLLALVAIAMGGLLIAKPALSIATPTGILLGLLASVALSLYITLTNISYRRQCHPMPTAVIQFSTVAVLSSLVLLVKPLEMVNISWLSFCLWGLLIGIFMLIAYFFTYSSLRLISGKTAIIAATTPFITLLLSWSFFPQPTLEIIQWTGVLLVLIGGIAISKEKLAP